jgi:hypothetical protein
MDSKNIKSQRATTMVYSVNNTTMVRFDVQKNMEGDVDLW